MIITVVTTLVAYIAGIMYWMSFSPLMGTFLVEMAKMRAII